MKRYAKILMILFLGVLLGTAPTRVTVRDKPGGVTAFPAPGSYDIANNAFVQAIQQYADDRARFQTGNVINVQDAPYNAKCDGVTDDSTAFNSLPANVTIIIPTGVCNIGTTTWVLKNNTNYLGMGSSTDVTKGTVIKYTGTGDAVKINNPINSSTAANITFKNLSIYSTNSSSVGAGLADVGSSYLTIDNVVFQGGKYGVIFDQTEVSNISNCSFNNQLLAGVWLVNLADHTPGANGDFTNRITIQKNQFNNSNASTVAVIDDGGYTHEISDNNFNGFTNHLYLAGVFGLNAMNNQFEGATSSIVRSTNLTYLGTSGPGASINLTFQSNIMVPTTGQTIFNMTNGSPLVLINNLFGNTTAAKVTGTSNVQSVISWGNANQGGGATFDGEATNHYQIDSGGNFTTNRPLTSTLAAGTAPLSVASTTPNPNFNGYLVAYNAAGTQQVSSYVQYGSVTLSGGTATVTLTHAFAITPFCWATDTTAANLARAVATSSSSVTVTGTTTDVINWICVGT